MKVERVCGALHVEWRHPSELCPDAKNSKIHTPKQIKQVARSIQEFGWTNPILIDEIFTPDSSLASTLSSTSESELVLR